MQLRLGAGLIVLLGEGKPQLIGSDRILRIIAKRALQRIHGAANIILTKLNLAFENKSFNVTGVGLEDLIVELGGLVKAVLEDQELDVVLGNLNISGVIFVKGTVFGGGFVDIVGSVKIAEQAIHFRVIREIPLGLLQEGLGLTPFALDHQESREICTRSGILGIDFNRVFKLLLGFWQAITRCVVLAQGQLRAHRLGIDGNCFLDTLPALLDQVGTNLQISKRQVGYCPIRIRIDEALRLLEGLTQIVLSRVVERPCFVGLGVIRPLVPENVEMFLSLAEV